MKFICNELYHHLIDQVYENQILYLTNEECDQLGADYDLSEIEGAILQPYYIQKDFLDRMPKLKWVQITGAGYDRVDMEEVRKRKITLTNTRGVMSTSIAEDVFAKMLFFSRRVRVVEKDKAERIWDFFGQDQWMCSCYDDLYGKVVGIMGYGSIGHEIAKRANAFEMKVYVYDIASTTDAFIDKSFIGENQLFEFYRACDYLVVSLPLTSRTRHFINQEALQSMKESAVLINVARGPIVDTDALYKALLNKQIQGAALDVFEEEPLSRESKLWNLDNLYISSHKAGMGDSWKRFLGRLIIDNIERYNKKEELINIIRER